MNLGETLILKLYAVRRCSAYPCSIDWCILRKTVTWWGGVRIWFSKLQVEISMREKRTMMKTLNLVRAVCPETTVRIRQTELSRQIRSGKAWSLGHTDWPQSYSHQNNCSAWRQTVFAKPTHVMVMSILW